MRHRLSAPFALALTFAASEARADDTVHRLTLEDALKLSDEAHPALETATKKEAAAQARVGIAKTDAIPHVGAVLQVNRSTGNAVPGATFAMQGIPTVAGPPGASRLGSGTWQTAAGVTASWNVLDLVRMSADVDAAESEVNVSRAETKVTRLAVASETIDSYYALGQAHAVVDAAKESEKRLQSFHDVVAAQVGQKLKPDADLARADSELASAQVAVARAKLGLNVASARLAAAIGKPEWNVDVAKEGLPNLPEMPPPKGKAHPEIALYEETAKAADARASAARLDAYLPRIDLLGAAWLRGGGYVLNGGPNSGTGDGIVPDTPNWAIGAVVSWAPTDIARGEAKARAENANAAVAKAKAKEISQNLDTADSAARQGLKSALDVAATTTNEVAASKRALELANARYSTGNASIVEVLDAERVLAAAERDEALARAEAWRAAAAVMRANGNVAPILRTGG